MINLISLFFYSVKKEENRDLQLTDDRLKDLLKNIEDFEYNGSRFWTPDLFIENAINVKEELRYKFKIVCFNI
jgi:hypothetical protein